MWKWYILFIVVVLLLLRFLSSTESKDQRAQTALMDQACVGGPNVPIHVLVWGSSEHISETLFELTQRAKCPRRLRMTVIEFVKDESAAVLQDRAVRLRGQYNTTFDDQIQWMMSTRANQEVLPDLMKRVSAISEPLCLAVFANMRCHWSPHWDYTVTSMLPQMQSQIMTCIPNAQSRLDPTTKRLQVQWMPLSMNHSQKFVEVVFPSHALFGSTGAMTDLFTRMHSEWPSMPWTTWPLVAPFLMQEFKGLVVMDIPKFISLQECMPVISKTQSNQLIAKWPTIETFFSEVHSLGLNPDSASSLEIILKQGSIKEFHKNIAHIRPEASN